MDIILPLLLLASTIPIFIILYRIIKWISQKKTRINWTLVLIGTLISAKIIDTLFFTKTEFIQSKVYPNLYLIKNPTTSDEFNSAIKQMVLYKLGKEFIGNEAKHRYKSEYISVAIEEGYNHIFFYEYYKGWGTNPYGEAGTAHFIENKEDLGGFSSELLEYYDEYLIADFYISFCKTDTTRYEGILRYYRKSGEIDTDTIINMCKN